MESIPPHVAAAMQEPCGDSMYNDLYFPRPAPSAGKVALGVGVGIAALAGVAWLMREKPAQKTAGGVGYGRLAEPAQKVAVSSLAGQTLQVAEPNGGNVHVVTFFADGRYVDAGVIR